MLGQEKFAICWMVFMAVLGGKIRQGRGVRLAVWIRDDNNPLDFQAAIIRWCLVAVSVLLIYQGWQLKWNASVDILLVAGGSLLEIAALYIPDFSFHVSSGLNRLMLREENERTIAKQREQRSRTVR